MRSKSLTIWVMIVAVLGVLFGTRSSRAAWNEEAKLNPSDAHQWNYFGIGVAIDGEYSIVGSTGSDDTCASGAAYVFKYDGETWQQQVRLPSPYGATCDQYGKAVAISGDYIIVSAVRDNENGGFSGAVYIFKRDGTIWTPQAKLTAADGQTYDNFGYSVSISGDYALVGAWGDNDGGNDSGAGYIFKRNGSTWLQDAKLKPGSAGDRLGLSVCINGDYAIIGGRPWPESRPGCAYVFKREGTGWVNQGKLTAPDGNPGDLFGYDRSVSINVDFAVVGAAGNGFGNSGAAYVYKRDGTSWNFHTKLTAWDAAAGDGFGNSVSISSDCAVIGAYGDDDNGGNSGSVYSFRYDGISWVPENKFVAPDGTVDDNFGYSVSINREHLIVGATSYERNIGGAYVFAYEKPSVAVSVDIKPGSCPNPLNVKSKGVLPIAILGTEDVNVIDIVPTSIAFSIGEVSIDAIRHSYEDVAAPVTDTNDCNCTEDGPDGFLDLTLKFKTQEIVNAIGEVNDGDILTLELTGVLFGERPIEGADCVLIRGKHKPFNKADFNCDGKVDMADFAAFADNWLESSIVDD